MTQRCIVILFSLVLLVGSISGACGYSEPEKDTKYTAEAYFYQARKLAAQGRYHDAIKEFNKAIELDPNMAEAYNNRGNSYKEIGEYDLAIADFSKAIELDPNMAWVYTRLVLTYNDRGFAYNLKGQPDYFVNNNDGTIEILARNGEVVARVGEEVRMGGGEIKSIEHINKLLKEPLPQDCEGPYWLMGEKFPWTDAAISKGIIHRELWEIVKEVKNEGYKNVLCDHGAIDDSHAFTTCQL